MRSSELFVVKVLWLAGTARDCSTEIEMAGKPRGIRNGLFSLIEVASSNYKAARIGDNTGNDGRTFSPKEKISTLSRCLEYKGHGKLNSNNIVIQTKEHMLKCKFKLGLVDGMSSECCIRLFSYDEHPVLSFCHNAGKGCGEVQKQFKFDNTITRRKK